MMPAGLYEARSVDYPRRRALVVREVPQEVRYGVLDRAQAVRFLELASSGWERGLQLEDRLAEAAALLTDWLDAHPEHAAGLEALRALLGVTG